DKGVSFGSLSRATGLAASSLVQRYGSIAGLLAAAACAGWQELIEDLAEAEIESRDKGPHRLLKRHETKAREVPHLLSLGARDTRARALAEDWRMKVEPLLVTRLGLTETASRDAKTLFLAWQGRLLWQEKDLTLKQLT